MLPSASPREVFLACPPFSRWNLLSRWSPLFPLHAAALIPLSLAKIRLSPILTLSPLIIWYSGETALLLFLLARAAPAFLPTALCVALRPLFTFWQAQYVQVFPPKPAPFCTLCWSRQHQQVCHFSYYLTLVLSSPPSFLLSQTLWQIWQEACLLSLLLFYQATMGCQTLVSPGETTRLMSLPDGERYLRPLQSLVVSLFYSLVSTFLGLEALFFNAQVPSISTEELVLPRHARCVLSHLRCNGHSLPLSYYLSRIGRIENRCCSASEHLSSHSALSSYGLCAAHSLATLYHFWS